MPIYEYRCAKCGFQKEYLQRLNEAQLTKCPECGKKTFNKMVTAAGFQLKGTGWYATDFKNNGDKTKAKDKAADGLGKPASGQESSGKESTGKESTGKESASKETAPKESSKSESSSTATAPAAGGR